MSRGMGGVTTNAAGQARMQIQELAYMLDDLQYMSTMGIRPIVNNLMMMNPVLGIVAMGFDQIIKNWTQLQKLWTGESVTRTQAEQMKELAKNTSLTVDETRRLTEYQQQVAEGKRLITQLTPGQEEQQKTVKEIFTNVQEDLGRQIQAIGEARAPTYTESQRIELERLQHFTNAQTAGQVAGEAQTLLESVLAGYADSAAYVRERMAELLQRGRGETQLQVGREFAGAETDPAVRQRLIEEMTRRGLAPETRAKLEAVQAGATVPTPEIMKEVMTVIHDQTQNIQKETKVYATEAEAATARIGRMNQAISEYQDRIDLVSQMLNRNEITSVAAEKAIERLRDEQEKLTDQTESLAQKEALLAETRRRALVQEEIKDVEQRAKEQEKIIVDRATQAYGGAMGGQLGMAYMRAIGRGEDPEAVRGRLMGQLQEQMQSVPWRFREDVARQVMDQIVGQAQGIAVGAGAMRDAQVMMAAGMANQIGGRGGVAIRQAIAEQQQQAIQQMEERQKAMGGLAPFDPAGFAARQAIAVQQDAARIRANLGQQPAAGGGWGDPAQQTWLGAGQKLDQAADKLLKGDIKVKF